MKKLFMIIAAMFIATNVAFADSAIKTSKVFDNTYVSVNVGASADLTPSSWRYEEDSFLETVRPTATLRLGKWITPVFGVEVEGEVGFGTVNVPTFVDHTYVGANAMLNVNNVVHGYRGISDKVEFVPYLGIGWWHGYGDVTNKMATQGGVKVNFNLDKARAWQLNVVPQITYLLDGDAMDSAEGTRFDVKRAYVGLQVGVTYNFKNHYGTHGFVVCDKAYTQSEMDALNEEVNRLRQSNANLAAALDACESRASEVEKVVEVRTVEKVVPLLPRVQFERGSALLATTSHSALAQIAETIKGSDNKWAVLGYASEEGTAQYNKELSLQRANVVKDELVRLGVNEEQLVVEGCGATTKFSTECRELNRVVEIGY